MKRKKRQNGGKRPGAGRPKGSKARSTIMREEAKQILIGRVLDKWENLLDAKLDLALGYYTWSSDGKRTYITRPDSGAISDLIEYVIGKPLQPIEGKFTGDITSGSMETIAQSLKNLLEDKGRRHEQPKLQQPTDQSNSGQSANNPQQQPPVQQPQSVIPNGHQATPQQPTYPPIGNGINNE